MPNYANLPPTEEATRAHQSLERFRDKWVRITLSFVARDGSGRRQEALLTAKVNSVTTLVEDKEFHLYLGLDTTLTFDGVAFDAVEIERANPEKGKVCFCDNAIGQKLQDVTLEFLD